MPKAQNKNGVRIASQLVNDPIGTVDNLANRWIPHFRNDLAHLRKCPDEDGFVDENIAKLASPLGTVSRNIRNYLL